MRVVYLADAPYIHTARWVEAFAGLGHECHVVSFRPAALAAASVHHVDGLERLGKARYLVHARRIAALVRSLEPDLVHALHATSYGFLGALTGVRPFVLSVEGMDVFEAPRLTPFHGWLVRHALARADVITASGLQLAVETARYAPRGRRIAVVPYGVDLERFRPAERPDSEVVTIGTVARLSPEKGIRYLLEAFSRLRDLVTRPVRLRIAGDGPERTNLEKLARRLGIAEVTRLEGWVEHDRLPAFLQSLDVFALPSLYESFGVAAAEAAAMALPVVASNLQGLPDVVRDGVTGRLVPPKRPDALAAGLAPLVTDAALRRRLGAAGRELVAAHYDWRSSVALMADIYDSARRGAAAPVTAWT